MINQLVGGFHGMSEFLAQSGNSIISKNLFSARRLSDKILYNIK